MADLEPNPQRAMLDKQYAAIMAKVEAAKAAEAKQKTEVSNGRKSKSTGTRAADADSE